MSSTDPAPRLPNRDDALAGAPNHDREPLAPGEVDAPLVIAALELAHHGLTEAQVQRLAPASLAYIGDAVYELYIRSRFLWPPQRSRDYHRQVVRHVNSTYQAQVADYWMARLTEQERDWWRRGRNAAVRRSNQSSHAAYQAASGLETLVGYLYLTDPHRLQELFRYLPPVDA